MFEGLFQPLHLLIILISAAMVFGMPFLAGYFLGPLRGNEEAEKALTPPLGF